jgi:hypothetical protein
MDGESVSMSLQRLWREYGGPQGLAKALQTNLKVIYSRILKVYFRLEFKDLQMTLIIDVKCNIRTIVNLCFRFGTNTKRIPKIRTLFELIKEAISDRTLVFLLILGTLNVIIQTILKPSIGWIDGVGIYSAVALIVGIQAQNNWSKEK